MPNETGTSEIDTDPIVREIDIAAEPDTVFGFFVEPHKLTRWLAVEATLDPRPGGACHQVHDAEPDQGLFHMRDEFLEVDPPKHPGASGASRPAPGDRRRPLRWLGHHAGPAGPRGGRGGGLT